MEDARAQQARKYHEEAAATSHNADMYRHRRDELVRQLRAEDPERWTYSALARAVGCSKELIAVIIKQAVVR